MNSISPLAFVNPAANIGNNVTIDAFAFIDKDTVIADNCHIRPHASVLQGTRLGQGVTIYEGAVVGAEPQDFRWKGEQSFVSIGDHTVIREHVIINRSIHEGQPTVIGSHSFIMAQSHIGHDSQIGDWCVLGNAVKIAGDCKVDDFSILSSNALLHERCEIGKWCMIKGGTRVNSHVPPYTVMAHNPIEYAGVNAFILRRARFSEEAIDNIAKAYRHIYQTNTSIFNAIRRIEIDIDDTPERREIVNFICNHNNIIAALPKNIEE